MNKSCRVRGLFVHKPDFGFDEEFHPLFGHEESPGFS